MGELETAELRHIVSKGSHSCVCEGTTSAQVKVTEFAWRHNGAVGQGVDFWFGAQNQKLKRLIVQVRTIGSDKSFKGVSLKEIEDECSIVPSLSFARPKILESGA